MLKSDVYLNGIKLNAIQRATLHLTFCVGFNSKRQLYSDPMKYGVGKNVVFIKHNKF